MQHPQVNLNGTSRSQLVEQYGAAYRALDKALEAITRAAPHGRDYLPQDPNGANYRRALDQFIAWNDKVLTVKNEVYQIYEKLALEGQ